MRKTRYRFAFKHSNPVIVIAGDYKEAACRATVARCDEGLHTDWIKVEEQDSLGRRVEISITMTVVKQSYHSA